MIFLHHWPHLEGRPQCQVLPNWRDGSGFFHQAGPREHVHQATSVYFRNMNVKLIVKYFEVYMPLWSSHCRSVLGIGCFCMLFASLCHLCHVLGNCFLIQAIRTFVQCVTMSGQEFLPGSYVAYDFVLYLMSYIRHSMDLDLVCWNWY